MQVKDNVIQEYTGLAPTLSEGEASPTEMAFGKFVTKNIEPGMQNALEIGCGVGRLAERVAQQIPNVLGLDITPAMIERAQVRARSSLKFVLGDVETYPFQGKFDLIYIILVFDHVERRKVFPILANLLNPNGLLLVVDRFEYAADNEIVRDFISYLRWRQRHGLGINILPLLMNMKRVSEYAVHPAWARLNDISQPYHISRSEYASLLKELLPSAQFDLIDQHTASVVYRKPRD